MTRFPSRIVCLTEETTETLYLLGQGDRIVGVSGYTGTPAGGAAEAEDLGVHQCKVRQDRRAGARSHFGVLGSAGGSGRGVDSARPAGRDIQPAQRRRDPPDDSDARRPRRVPGGRRAPRRAARGRPRTDTGIRFAVAEASARVLRGVGRAAHLGHPLGGRARRHRRRRSRLSRARAVRPGQRPHRRPGGGRATRSGSGLRVVVRQEGEEGDDSKSAGMGPRGPPSAPTTSSRSSRPTSSSRVRRVSPMAWRSCTSACVKSRNVDAVTTPLHHCRSTMVYGAEHQECRGRAVGGGSRATAPASPRPKPSGAPSTTGGSGFGSCRRQTGARGYCGSSRRKCGPACRRTRSAGGSRARTRTISWATGRAEYDARLLRPHRRTVRGAGYLDLVDRILDAGHVRVGAPTLVEASLVFAGRRRKPAAGELEDLVKELAITVVPFGEAEWRVAVDAFARFGRGRHQAALNFGDCLGVRQRGDGGRHAALCRRRPQTDRHPTGVAIHPLPPKTACVANRRWVPVRFPL